MAEKVSTLIIESDLACEKCYRIIQNVLYKLQEIEKIRTINFDTKFNTVTISGPIDPVKLSRKLRVRASKAIKDIKIVEEKKLEPKKEKNPAVDSCKYYNKPDVKKPVEEKPKSKEEPKAAAALALAPSTTVTIQFTQMCNLCYPCPCSNPSHWGGVHHYPQPQPQPPPAIPAFTGHHHPYPPRLPATPKRQPCGGPSYCGGCGSCGGAYNGWQPAMPTPTQIMQPQPMGCGGQTSTCRGCQRCWIVQEEYPQNTCAIM